MQFEKLFRRKIFGGFNKADVEAYVKTLEDELEKVRETSKASTDGADKEIIAESLNEIRKLKLEREDMINQMNLLRVQLKNQAANQSVPSSSVDAETYLKVVEENASLKSELQKVQDDQQQYHDDKELIGRVLRDAKVKADLILKEADTEFERKIQDADRVIEVRREQVYQELQKELERKVIDFITVKYRLADYISGIESIREQLSSLSGSLQTISQEMPVQVVDLIEKAKKEDIVDTKYIEGEIDNGKKKTEKK